MGPKDQSKLSEPFKELDILLTQIAAGVSVDIMPGPNDPANFALPQQPLNRRLFPGSSVYNTFRSCTNPHSFELNGIRFLGTSGQNIDDLEKYSEAKDKLEFIEKTLTWRHLAPTAPNTLGGNEYGQCGEDPEKDETGRLLRRDIATPQRCAPKLTVRQVAAGGTHSVVLTREGHVWTWGQPWPPGDIKQIFVPVRVQGPEKVRLIVVGAFHNLALEEDGTLWAWGNNEYGQLGTGDTQPRSQPIRVQGLSGLTLVDIAAGGWHSTALTNEGEVYGWGRGEHGRLGFGDDKSSKMLPQKVQLLAAEDIVQVSCGGTHSVALTRDGRIFSYGRGDHGRLGYGRKVTTGHPMEVPINLPPPKTVSEEEKAEGHWRANLIACGGRHTLAIVKWQPNINNDDSNE